MGALSLNIILYELQIANLIKNTITYGRLQKTGGNQYKSKNNFNLATRYIQMQIIVI